MRIVGEVTIEMGLEAYSRIRNCPRCGKQVIEACPLGKGGQGRAALIYVDVKTYVARPGMSTLVYEVNPLTGKLVDGVQWVQPVDLESGAKRAWRHHEKNCKGL